METFLDENEFYPRSREVGNREERKQCVFVFQSDPVDWFEEILCVQRVRGSHLFCLTYCLVLGVVKFLNVIVRKFGWNFSCQPKIHVVGHVNATKNNTHFSTLQSSDGNITNSLV